MNRCITNRILPALTIFALGCAGISAAPAAAYQLGDAINDFTLDDLQGSPVSLSAYAGDIVLINFFATWCPGCNEEAAILENDIHLVYGEYGVTVIAIDVQEPAWLVADWAAAQGVTYQILLAPDWELFSQFPTAGGLPYNAIIDRDNILRYGEVLFDRDALIGTLNALLGFDPVSDATTSFGGIKALYR
jgi:peroxiredoxin